MGATSYITSKRLFAENRGWYSHAMRSIGGSGVDFSNPGRAWLKRAILPVLAGVAMQAFAVENDPLPELELEAPQSEVVFEVSSSTEAKAEPTKVIDFVLAEVRKHLDPNPETEIVELTVDPDYHGPKETYLVNAVLDAHGRRLSVGVMVTVKYTADGPQATLGFVD